MSDPLSGVVLITPTRDRPLAFELCQKYVARQSYTHFTWLVVDDGDEPVEFSVPNNAEEGLVRVEYLRRSPSNERNTLPQNMLAALAHPLLLEPKRQLVIMFEDDEWYHPDYVQQMVEALLQEGRGLVGFSNARYYHIQNRCLHQPTNHQHASLCRTAWVHGPEEQLWITLCTQDALRSGDPFIDMRAWGRRGVRNGPSPPPMKLLGDRQRLSVGIKGMPGRAGLGVAHKNTRSWKQDPEGVMLKAWTSEEDRDIYFAIPREEQRENGPTTGDLRRQRRA